MDKKNVYDHNAKAALIIHVLIDRYMTEMKAKK